MLDQLFTPQHFTPQPSPCSFEHVHVWTRTNRILAILYKRFVTETQCALTLQNCISVILTFTLFAMFVEL